MSLMFLNPFDTSGMGLYSKSLKNFVQSHPVLKKKDKSIKPKHRYSTLQSEEKIDQDIDKSISIIAKSLNAKHIKNNKNQEPFSKSVSREQKARIQDGINNNPAVGSYRPRSIARPKAMWNILNVFHKNIANRKQILSRKNRATHSLSCIKQNKQDYNKGQQNNYLISTQNPENQIKRLSSDQLKYKKSQSFVQMKKMLGRTNSNKNKQTVSTSLSYSKQQILFHHSTKASYPKISIIFDNQVSRQKANSVLFKKSRPLQYECNYNLVSLNTTQAPDFQKTINRDGYIISSNQSKPIHDYSQIWCNKFKKNLPNLQLILQRKIKKQRQNRVKNNSQKH